MPLDPKFIGKQYDPIEFTVEEDMGKKYALATNDENPFYIDENRPGGPVAPPMIAVVYGGASFIGPAFDPELEVNFGMLVHGSQDMTFHRLVKPGEVISTQSRIADIEAKASGDLLTVGFESRDRQNELVTSGAAQFFIRGPRNPNAKKSPPKEQETRGQIVLTEKMQVTEDQTYRYADASGDHNPIHVNPEFAKSVGLPGIILQGLCTMAFVQKAVVDQQLGGDPTKLRRLAVRFRKPVLPSDTVITEGWVKKKEGDTTVLGLEAKNQEGAQVITDGEAETLA